jgi:hypothetical protein
LPGAVVVGSFGLLPDVAGSGVAGLGAVPDGVFASGGVPVLVVADGVVDESVALPLVVALLVGVLESAGAVVPAFCAGVALSGAVVLLDIEPLLDDVLGDELDIAPPSVFGVSVLLHAVIVPMAATAAATAIHLIERSMFAPVGEWWPQHPPL